MNGLVSAIGHVTGFFSLAAFVVAGLLLYNRFRLREESRRLESLPKAERAAAAEALLDRMKISVEGLPHSQRYDLAKRQLETLQRRDLYRFAITLVATLIAGLLWWQSQRIDHSVPATASPLSKGALPAPEEIERDQNARFEFSFLYPKTWDRRDPTNGDGHLFVHPTDTSVRCAFYGHHTMPDMLNVPEGSDPSTLLAAEVKESLSFDEREPGFKLLLNTESGRHVHRLLPAHRRSAAVSNDTNYIESWEHVEGRRIVYRTLESGEPITHMTLFLVYDGRTIGGDCEAPESRFETFEPLFLTLLSGVRVLDTGRPA
jgi:hypothetical protein